MMSRRKALIGLVLAGLVALALSPTAGALPTFACTPEDLLGCLPI